MVLYLAIVLLSVHLARADDASKAEDLALIWGTAVGLGLAHLFAYDLTAVLAEGRATSEDLLAGAGQIIAAVLTAFLASIPYLLTDAADASSVSSLILLGLISMTAYLSARKAGANHPGALLFTVVIVAVAVVVVIIKYSLTH
jgi:hypothetical protein